MTDTVRVTILCEYRSHYKKEVEIPASRYAEYESLMSSENWREIDKWSKKLADRFIDPYEDESHWDEFSDVRVIKDRSSDH